MGDNLPARGELFGRLTECEAVLDQLLLRPPRPVLIRGGPGVGKSELALHLAYQIRDESLPALHHHIWISAKAASTDKLFTPTDIDRVCSKIANVSRHRYINEHALDQKVDETVSLLTRQHSLIVFDNFESVEDPRVMHFMDRIPEGNAILVTSRKKLEPGARVEGRAMAKPLYGLGYEDTNRLIDYELERTQSALLMADDDRRLIYAYSVGEPYAVKLLVGRFRQGAVLEPRASAEQHSTLLAVSEDLVGDTWSRIDDNERLGLQLLSVFGDVVPAEVALSAMDGLQLDSSGTVKSLEDRALVDLRSVNGYNEYSLHPLMRAFALSRLDDSDSTGRLLTACATAISQQGDQQNWQGSRGGWDDLERQLDNLTRVQDLCEQHLQTEQMAQPARQELLQQVAKLASLSNVALWSRGYWTERVEVCTSGARAAKAVDDAVEAIWLTSFISIVHIWRHSLSDARATVSEGRRIALSIGLDPSSLASIALDRCEALIDLHGGAPREAAEKLQRIRQQINEELLTDPELNRIADWVSEGHDAQRVGIVALEQEIGISLNKAGAFDEAREWLELSLSSALAIDDQEGQAVSHSHLGNSLQNLGRRREAKRHFRLGLGLAEAVGRQSTIGRCALGLAAAIVGPLKKLRRAELANKAASSFERLGMADELDEVRALM